MKKNIIFTLIGFIFGGGFGFALGIYALPIIIAKQNAKQNANNPTTQIVENIGTNQDSMTAEVISNGIATVTKANIITTNQTKVKTNDNSNKINQENANNPTTEIIENIETNQDSMTAEVISNGIATVTEANIITTNKINQLKKYTASFNPDAIDSDFFHWGKGDITVTSNQIIFNDNVELAPGPDYRLYLIPKYLEKEDEFYKIKNDSVEIDKVIMFDGKQIFNIDANIDIEKYSAVLIWCEAFGEFITVAKYK